MAPEELDLGLEATALRLGMPGGGGGGKRGFVETIDLKLKLMSSNGDTENAMATKSSSSSTTFDPAKPSAPKAQVVGWPPVRSYRKNVLQAKEAPPASSVVVVEEKKAAPVPAVALVKVSMDGAPYLRKVDLRLCGGYKELSQSLEKMFGSFSEADKMKNTIGGAAAGADYLTTYEDKDRDWMLVGDVPWEMFVETCKRLRIMRGTEAISGRKPKVSSLLKDDKEEGGNRKEAN